MITRTCWIPEEDQLLISAWLKFSKVSTTRNDLKKTECNWKQVSEFFIENQQGGAQRSRKQLKQRWHRLNNTVMEFVRCCNRVSQCENKMSEDDVITNAHQLFFSENGTRFTFEHAWRLLRDEPKWRDTINTSGDKDHSQKTKVSNTKRTKVSECGTYTSSSNLDLPTSGDVGFSEVRETSQPSGQKAEKRKQKTEVRENSAGTSAEQLEEIKELEKRKVSAMEELAQAKKISAQAKQFKADMKIIYMDTANMTEEQQQFHEIFVKRLKEKYLM